MNKEKATASVARMAMEAPQHASLFVRNLAQAITSPIAAINVVSAIQHLRNAGVDSRTTWTCLVVGIYLVTQALVVLVDTLVTQYIY